MLRLSGITGMRIFALRQRIENAGAGRRAFPGHKHQIIAILIAYGAVGGCALCRQRKQALRVFGGDKGGIVDGAEPRRIRDSPAPRGVSAIILCKTPSVRDDVQTKAGIGAKTNDVAGIRRDWFEEYDVKHDAPNAGQNSRNSARLTRRVQRHRLCSLQRGGQTFPQFPQQFSESPLISHGFRAGQVMWRLFIPFLDQVQQVGDPRFFLPTASA